jgi:iron complex transport system substrate-binding protein
MDTPAITAIPATATINRFRLIRAVPEGLEVEISLRCADRLRGPPCFRRTELSASPKRPSKRCICWASKAGPIVGISGYVVRPPQARREKPRVSAFTSANIDTILTLKPDLVLTFSDLQADIVADLVRRGLEVHAFNQRTISGILDMIRTLGAMVDASERARQLVRTLETRLADVRTRTEGLPKRPRVFFEEWDDPLISGIGWVSELVEIAGGVDIFADRRNQGSAKDRVVTHEEVIAREPDLIIGSRCGKKFRPERVATRAGFDRIPAVPHEDLYEIKSSLILQPGPAALTDGLAELQRIIEQWAPRPCLGLDAASPLIRFMRDKILYLMY